ncbi:MAG TPA: glycosyltransferase [Bryobacteraceae bacterium]|nr:glycosyltransferase [Bryobacteraceae bacterium]
MSVLSRLALENRDRLRHSRNARQLIARTLLLKAGNVSSDTGPNDIARSIVELCRIARVAQSDALMLKVEAEINRRIQAIDGRALDWSTWTPSWKTDQIEKAVVLKPWVSERERGVAFVSFEYQWARIMGIRNLPEFARRYALVIAPSWSPPHTIETTLFPVLYPDSQIFSIISNVMDIKILPRLSKKFRVVPLYSSNWVNPDLYPKVPFAEKDIDIVMLAGFGIYKRHFALFQALRELPSSVKVVLVGQQVAGRTAQTLFDEARLYGVQDRFELRENVSDEEVTRTLARAKLSIILSNQEGSCVAVVESMFADTPVGIYEDAIIGSGAFINQHTGRFFKREGLGAQLREFLAAAPAYTPRKWVIENGVGCRQGTAGLNRVLKEAALEAGEDWTRDIFVHHLRPDPVLLRPEDRASLDSEYEDIRARFGVRLGRN